MHDFTRGLFLRLTFGTGVTDRIARHRGCISRPSETRKEDKKAQDGDDIGFGVFQGSRNLLRVCFIKGFKEVLNILIQLFLIRLHGQAVICLTVKDFLTELALGQKRVRGDDETCDIKRLQELDGNRDFIGLFTDGTFCYRNAELMKASCEEMRSACIFSMTVA